MGAILGGTMRAPITGVIFAFELTHDVNALLPLLLAVTLAHGFTVLTLRRSILTEKVSRRGYHLSREYPVDPLEIVFAREVARTGVVAVPADATRQDVRAMLARGRPVESTRSPIPGRRNQRLFPLVDASRRLVNVVTRSSLRDWLDQGDDAKESLADVVHPHPVIAYGDEPLRVLAFRMAETGVTRMPVVERRDRTLIGMVGLSDLLTARARVLEAEQRRERMLGSKIRFFGRSKSAA